MSLVYQQPGYVLHQKKYRETSLIIDVLTPDFGRFSLLARGVRKAKSKTVALLQAFIPLSLSFVDTGAELKILTDVDSLQPDMRLNGLSLYSGFYVNELVMTLLHRHDPEPELFMEYVNCVQQLAEAADATREAALRRFEVELLARIGYGVPLQTDYLTGLAIDASKKYAFNIEHGPYAHEQGDFQGSTLLALNTGCFNNRHSLQEAKQLMRLVIDSHLQGRVLKSRQVMNQIVKKIGNE